MKNYIFTLLILSFGLMIFGCNQASVDTIASNTVMSSQIYQIYYIEASKSQTNVIATFRVGGSTGTTLDLTEPGKILFNGKSLSKSDPSNLIGTNYRMKGTDYRGFLKGYNPAGEFSFTDNDGKTFLNTVNLLPVEVSANSGFTLQASQPTTIPLSRTIGNDETLTVSIDTIIDDEISKSENSVYLNASRNAVIITPKYWQTKSLKAKAELIIKVKKSTTVSQGTPLGGSISAVYSAAPLIVGVNSAKTAAVNANTTANAKTSNAVTNTNSAATANKPAKATNQMNNETDKKVSETNKSAAATEN